MNHPSLPLQYARTRRFTLGRPRSFTLSPDGGRVVFLRTRGGQDPVTCLWEMDVASGRERLIADPGSTDEQPSQTEAVRRERAREQSVGITAYSTDDRVRRVAYALGGQIWLADLDDGDGRVRPLPAHGPAVAPCLDPSGSSIAYVSGGALRTISTRGLTDQALAVPEGSQVTYGLPEHVAAESMGRQRAFWWAPDGARLLVARADVTRVQRWYIADPADPARPPVEIAYPAAGTANADVSLWIIDVSGGRVAVDWDRRAFEYVTAACWSGPEPLVVVQSRDQKTMRVLSVDPETGATAVRRQDTDPCWVQIVPGVPALTAGGRLVWTADLNDTRRLLIDDIPVTPPGLNVREVLGTDGETVLFTASAEPTETGLWTYDPDTGSVPFADGPGVHHGHRRGGTTVVVAESLDHHGAHITVHGGQGQEVPITSFAETPVLTPRIELLRAGGHELRTAVLFPAGHVPGSRRLPVLMDPYGGPAAQRVQAARDRFLVSQWFADQGFAVIVADGRGTPGRGWSWERAIHGDRASTALADQVTALHEAADRHPDLDLGRVGIRGWSFGGFLAALAVLREPEVFHAAVAGAGVYDQRLYDTHWSERFLGHPADDPAAYDRSSLIDDAPRLRRPLMLIHGLADDNVNAAHTFRLSSALTATGRPHTVLPLPNVTHMTPQVKIAEKLLIVEADFFQRTLSTFRAPDRAGGEAVR
ncbi:prolyl oligopeptidase family serine peptidase [Nonomuraea phyllanthi]|uniref:prolyl oligopeptidase family serine peptidase n=1 Tax=Nonomuraea phyllanthi TaxID=2219224 RepID=UPI00129336A5|nr:prolyl oligopeptidase family serine peptidase [Nonomuraea phyllanthi]QFY10257.1 prolyl oligopeptidase family serine peptidase [Nonomuraea phyllanthi]